MYTVGPGPVCKCMGQCTLEGSVQGGGVYTGGAKLHSLPVYTAPYIYIPGLALQCTLPFQLKYFTTLILPIKVYVRKLFKLKNDGKKYLCLLSICTANLNRINNMNPYSNIVQSIFH